MASSTDGARLRILWVSDSPTSPTGYGMVTAEVCRRLAARGHQVEILGWPTRGRTTLWEGILVHPIGLDLSGRDVLPGLLEQVQPDILVTLGTAHQMRFLADQPFQELLERLGTRWALYYPLGATDPTGRLPEDWVRVLQTVDLPVAMSQFGARVMAAAGIEAAYVPHGCDLDVFAPPADRAVAKADLGYDGAFVVLSDARNQPRKLWPRMLDVIAAFMRDKPDVIAHLHCDPDDDAATSPFYTYRLRADVAALGIEDRVRFTEGFRMGTAAGLPPESLASLYAAADVHLLCSWGEGFGLPTLQAASAGVVPLAVDYSANTELLGEHGFAIPSESVLLDENGLACCLLSREEAVAALDRLYRDRALLAKRSRRARAFALDYGWDRVVDQWEAVLRSAPPRQRRSPTRLFTEPEGHLPPPELTRSLPVEAGASARATVQVRWSTWRYGRVARQVSEEIPPHGATLALPVRLPPAFPGAPGASIGRVMVGPDDLGTAARLLAIFPALTVAVPMTSGDVDRASFLPIEQLVPRLAHCALVIDDAGQVPLPLGFVCAALGVPYLGQSRLWPEVVADSPFRAARALLTDQGLSDWRRQVAGERAVAAVGPRMIDEIRALARTSQPKPHALGAQELDRQPEPVRDLVRQMLGLLAGERGCEQVVARRAGALLSRCIDAEAEEILGIVLEQRAQRFLANNAPVGVGHFVPLEQLQAIDVDTRVYRPDYLACSVSVTGERASIIFLGGTVSGPSRIEPELRFVSTARSFLVRDLPGRLGDRGKLVLIRRLVSEGLLIVEAA
jgi:glycosyltransferase involved in cell wall biosynthesis